MEEETSGADGIVVEGGGGVGPGGYVEIVDVEFVGRGWTGVGIAEREVS